MKMLSILSRLVFLIPLCLGFKIVAHRGASGYLPEHTLESKVASFFMHIDYIEQDVVLTKDFKPLVLHDINLDGVTDVAVKYPERKRSDGRFYAIDFTLAEIKTLQATERFRYEDGVQYYPDRFPKGNSSFQLNTLDEEIELIQGLDASLRRAYAKYDPKLAAQLIQPGIYVEIKQPDFHRDEKAGNISEIVLAVLDKYGYRNREDNAIIQCFDPAESKRIREELKSKLTIVQLLEANQESDGIKWTSLEGLQEIKKFADGIGPEKDMLVDYDTVKYVVRPSELHKNAKKLGLFMHPYTFRVDQLPKYANSYQQLMKIFIQDLQVEGLFTDFPDLTKVYVDGLSSATNRIQSNSIFVIIFALVVSLLSVMNH